MVQLTYTVESLEELRAKMGRFAEKHPGTGNRLLILLFTHSSRKEDISAMTGALRERFPEARIAGMTVSGAISDGTLAMEGTVVSFLAFEESDVDILTWDLTEKDAAAAGDEALKTLVRKDRMAGLCCLTTIPTVDPAPFLASLSFLPPELPVFGGSAEFPTEGSQAFIFTAEQVLDKGVILLVFTGKLRIGVKSLLGWHGMGRYMTITATNGDLTLSTLDGRPAVEIYEKYLKINRSRNFGQEILSFPLLLSRHGKELARLPAGCLDDGSLTMNGDCHTGELVRLAYGDPSEILRTCRELSHRIWHFHPQGLLMFSCITRRTFLKDDTRQVLAMYQNVPSLAGGYVHGEIKRSQGVVDILNMTQVTAGFSEKPLSEEEEKIYLEPVNEAEDITLSDSLSTLERLAAFVSTTSEELEQAYHQISYVAEHDGLTGLYNRRTIESIMEGEVQKSAISGTPLSAIMIDLDNFKAINDNYGHEVGDAVLKTVANLMKTGIRRTDHAGRWGGDEFVILLPGTSLAVAEKVAGRIRAAFLAAPALEENLHPTASFGCAASGPGETQEHFYRTMDAALYKAKESGKNTVVVVESSK